MNKVLAAAIAVSAASLGACNQYGDGYGYGPGYAGDRGDWDAARYYRDDPRYSERRLGRNDAIYRGRDGRYYCRRDDGTSGLIIGGVAGGVLGNIIAPGGSKTIGTILGGAAGAVLGQQVDRGDVRCR
ncbi:glycine zipper 2TM domain-containing protein [Sphingomonas sp. FW199]|uniref:glycine zipper 2TM domain-containing protein n=1 Tax=unclassified Sphingomonas TaxID=196159 RepID=UPI0021A4B34F|nr:glycine zipper 2TM domain-containing protein [Sphingomonas sp. BGYR3]MDG5488322.1 glycine zipper 2TM domain-containing protein [Sphingomonas sp. BGYR3]